MSDLSYCALVKNELVNIRPSGCCKPYLVYGFMLFARSFSYKRIALQTANENVAKAYCDLIYSIYHIKPEIKRGGEKRPTFVAEIVSPADRLKILASLDFGMNDKFIVEEDFPRECCFQSFLRGAFLACGNINDPEKEYRAEFNIKNEQIADELLEILEKFGIILKKNKRASGVQLYTKDSTVIEDLLTLMHAGKISLEIINKKIEKSFRNDTNRARNCDDANISKTVEASLKQRTAIEYLEKNDKLFSLPEELQYVARLRMNNPSLSLKELCRVSEHPLTVSGLNHRLSKIIELYEKIKND